MFEAVLFDLDGTLIQFSACYADFMRDMATMWGITDAADPFFDHYGTAILAEGAVTFRSSIEFALAATGRKPSRDFNDQCRDAVRGYAGGIAVLPGTLELLASLIET